MPVEAFQKRRRVALSMFVTGLLLLFGQQAPAQTGVVNLQPPLGALTRGYSTLFFSTASSGYVVTDSEILHTSDAGQHWDMRAQVDGRIEQCAFLNEDIAWLYTAGVKPSLQRTRDGFHTLEKMSTQFALRNKARDGIISRVSFFDSDHGWAVGGAMVSFTGSGNHVAVTADGGRTWTGNLVPVELGDVNMVVMFSLREGIAQTDRGIIRTSDGGATWQAVPNSPHGFRDIQCIGPSLCIGLGEINAILVFRDGGSAWEVENVPIDKPPHADGRDLVNNFQFLAMNRAYIFGQDTHIPPTANRQVAASDGRRLTPRFPKTSFVVAYDGATWVRHDYPDIASLGVGQFVDDLNGWAVSSANNIFRTTDGGASWVPVQDYFRQIADRTPSPTPFVIPTPAP